MGKDFTVLSLLVAILLSASCGQGVGGAEMTAKSKKFDKIVVILSDDHAHHVTGSYGNDLIRTPNIDRFAASGIQFTHAYCNAPICSASRQSLLTGKYPIATGVNLLFTPFPDFGNVTIAERLRDEGFETALIGKSHFNNWAWSSLYEGGLPDHGFDQIIDVGDYRDYLKGVSPPNIPDSIETYDRQSAQGSIGAWMNADVLPHPVQDEFSEGTFLANQAIEFLEANKEHPFFLWVAFRQPHHPYYFPVEYRGKYSPDEVPLPMGSEEDDRWVPEKFRSLSEQERRGIIASYYTSTEYLDKNVGLVLDALDELDLDDETVVLYLSDNGYLLYDHKRFEKHTMWEESLRQPTAIKIPGEEPQVIDDLVEYVDIMPTILDLVGVGAPKEVQGKSLLPTLTENNRDHKEYVFATYLEDNMAAVRTDRWKYVFHTGSRDLGIGYKTGNGPSGLFHALYDLEEDPGESRNLAGSPQHKETLISLQQTMVQHFMATHPDASDCSNTLTTEGKLVWFCEPRDVGVDQSLVDVPVRVFPVR